MAQILLKNLNSFYRVLLIFSYLLVDHKFKLNNPFLLDSSISHKS